MAKFVAQLAVWAGAVLAIGVPMVPDDTPTPPTPNQPCYQKLLYRICVGDDGQWHVDPVPALPPPGAGTP